MYCVAVCLRVVLFRTPKESSYLKMTMKISLVVNQQLVVLTVHMVNHLLNVSEFYLPVLVVEP